MSAARWVAAALLAGACVARAAGGATWPGPAFPHFERAQQIEAACERGLVAARARVAVLERRRPDAGWIGAYDDLNALTEDAYYPIGVLSNVHPDKALRSAAQACELRWQDFSSTLGQNEKLYQAARRVKPRDAVEREFMRVALETFEDAGVGLPKRQRVQAKQLADRIAALGLEFDKAIRDEGTWVPFTEVELRGMPEAAWKDARRDGQGRVLLGLDEPTYFSLMQGAQDAGVRERMWRAKTNEGGEGNLKRLAEITQLRREYAGLFGVASYADFVLRRRMAQDTQRTSAFLAEVKGAVSAREQRELAELREAKARHLAQPVEATRFERWDQLFYAERLKRERFSVDQELFRPYLPTQASLQFVMRIAETLFAVRYERVPAKLWHPDVQAYAVLDAASGKPLAGLLVDLYPREGKYNSAAVWSYRNAAIRGSRLPQATLVVNFDRRGLTLEDLETSLLHEFGHALHNNLSATRYSAQGGTNVLSDFVEAPSQMLEDWVYDKRVLALFKQVCADCKPVPDDLLAQANAARNFGKGLRYARQHLYASYDLALYAADAPDPMALWAAMEGATPLGYVSGTRFPAGFSHLATNYAAGYYGYLWSEVVAMDLRTAFATDKLSPAVGKRYRDLVISQGGQRPPQDLLRDFLGRETHSKAFFEDLAR